MPSASWILMDTDGIDFQQEISETWFYIAVWFYNTIHIMGTFPCSWPILWPKPSHASKLTLDVHCLLSLHKWDGFRTILPSVLGRNPDPVHIHEQWDCSFSSSCGQSVWLIFSADYWFSNEAPCWDWSLTLNPSLINLAYTFPRHLVFSPLSFSSWLLPMSPRWTFFSMSLACFWT